MQLNIFFKVYFKLFLFLLKIYIYKIESYLCVFILNILLNKKLY